jgi:succinate dehydrogenase / fumarate reductase iron-sulfur subunit/fumarate reductase iron-sulfur subunit
MQSCRLKITRTASAGVSNTREYVVPVDRQMTVLDALFHVQQEQDSSLAFRCSCRVGMCGTCAMMINWQPKLACQTRIETLEADTITVGPLEHLPVIKDLVVSLQPFFEKWKQIRPALHAKNPNDKTLAIVPPSSEFGQQAHRKWDCITCGACYSACGLVGTNDGYVGPAAINKAMLRLLDPRDNNVNDRLKVLDSEEGVWRCHTQFNCVAACPKGLNLTDSIMRMKRAMLRPGKFNDKRNFVNPS